MLRILLMTFIFMFSTSGTANEVRIETTPGKLVLNDVLQACKEIADSSSTPFVIKGLPGKIITINYKRYEIRQFSFEDTSGNLPKSTTFQQYAKNNHLLNYKSVGMDPFKGIHFESFEFRRANLNDGVYFGIAMRELD